MPVSQTDNLPSEALEAAVMVGTTSVFSGSKEAGGSVVTALSSSFLLALNIFVSADVQSVQL